MERTLKQKRCLLHPAAAIAIGCALGLTGLDAAENVEAAIESVRRVGTDGQGFDDALPAAQQLAFVPPSSRRACVCSRLSLRLPLA